MKPLRILLIATCFLLASCTTTKLLTSSTTPAEINDLKLLEPYSYISMITRGNYGEQNDSISDISKQLNISILTGLKGRIPLTGQIFVTDEATNMSLEEEYGLLINSILINKSISTLKITPTLDKILEANQTRFGLIVVTSGFTRVSGNYGKEIAKGAAIGLLTLGMYYQTPIKAQSTVYCLIVDSQEDNITFYRRSSLQDKEPLDRYVLGDQYNSIFGGYFFPKQ